MTKRTNRFISSIVRETLDCYYTTINVTVKIAAIRITSLSDSFISSTVILLCAVQPSSATQLDNVKSSVMCVCYLIFSEAVF